LINYQHDQNFAESSTVHNLLVYPGR